MYELSLKKTAVCEDLYVAYLNHKLHHK